MRKIKILLVNSQKKGNSLQLEELYDIYPNSEVVVKNDTKSAVSEIISDDYDIVVLNNNPTDKETDIFKTIRRGSSAPSVVVVKDKIDNPGKIQQFSPETLSYLCRNGNHKDKLTLAIVNAVKKHKLLNKNRKLQSKTNKLARNPDIAEIILSYNHEINNPLTTILGNTQILLKSCRSKKNVQYIEKLEKIEDAVRRIQQITQNLSSGINLKSLHHSHK